ncbi:hypothetical protein G6O67_008730 [Ophiocordyceps sinensis]|uniref:Transcription factor, FAR1-related protein n=2 Tax=Ophiocordyceps sinensis TaxID=72228 RepID=A0A8H4LRN6_9HYPO|nr:Transcription factor, FAR1-related protein [Ophiocordyceps sinensis CO18]KAF4504118.1 hypothetical protein G6O67_008730 [Ophiocordyceps sinensis]
MESLYNTKFTSYQAAQAACDAIARTQGFALAIRTKKPNAADPSYIHFRCSKGGRFVGISDEVIANSNAKRRKTNTQMTECPYRLIMKLDRGIGTWSVSSAPAGSAHNHPFVAPMDHAKYRGEAISRYLDEIVQMYNSGTRPVHIAEQLRGRSHQDPDLEGITATQIHNALARHRRDERDEAP